MRQQPRQSPAGRTTLPPPRRPGRRYRVGLVCLGNICRSPTAQVVLTERLARAGLADRVEVTSSGTGDWHLGHPMDRRAADALASAGYDGSAHRARQFSAGWFEEYDVILAMDQNNHRDLVTVAPDQETARDRVRMFRDFDPHAGGGDIDVPDPYYGDDDGFAGVLAIIERTSEGLADALAEQVT